MGSARKSGFWTMVINRFTKQGPKSLMAQGFPNGRVKTHGFPFGGLRQ